MGSRLLYLLSDFLFFSAPLHFSRYQYQERGEPKGSISVASNNRLEKGYVDLETVFGQVGGEGRPLLWLHKRAKEYGLIEGEDFYVEVDTETWEVSAALSLGAAKALALIEGTDAGREVFKTLLALGDRRRQTLLGKGQRALHDFLNWKPAGVHETPCATPA